MLGLLIRLTEYNTVQCLHISKLDNDAILTQTS